MNHYIVKISTQIKLSIYIEAKIIRYLSKKIEFCYDFND